MQPVLGRLINTLSRKKKSSHLLKPQGSKWSSPRSTGTWDTAWRRRMTSVICPFEKTNPYPRDSSLALSVGEYLDYFHGSRKTHLLWVVPRPGWDPDLYKYGKGAERPHAVIILCFLIIVNMIWPVDSGCHALIPLPWRSVYIIELIQNKVFLPYRAFDRKFLFQKQEKDLIRGGKEGRCADILEKSI